MPTTGGVPIPKLYPLRPWCCGAILLAWLVCSAMLGTGAGVGAYADSVAMLLACVITINTLGLQNCKGDDIGRMSFGTG